jgi:hypothetical protein
VRHRFSASWSRCSWSSSPIGSWQCGQAFDSDDIRRLQAGQWMMAMVEAAGRIGRE